AWGKVSSSMPENAHPLKREVVRAALAAAGLAGGQGASASPGDGQRAGAAAGAQQAPGSPGGKQAPVSALEIAAAIGDPMQPFVAGLALSALPTVPVLLAGGSQMAAVLALIVALARERGQPLDLDRLGIATTCWVARDPTA